MTRRDGRDIDRFKRDIYIGTKIEEFWFGKWMRMCRNLNYINVSSPRSNGVDNTGGYIEDGRRTSGADHMVDIEYHALSVKNMPLEIKWAPTYGKLTLKAGDLKGYVREKAGILFIYPSEETITLRQPRDYHQDADVLIQRHIEKIESCIEVLRWSIMSPNQVKHFLTDAEENGKIETIKYMGFKPGVILPAGEFKNWFVEERWE